MSKLLFVPDWLFDELNSSGQSLETLIDDIDSALVSNADVVNYHKAQWQFFKLVCAGTFSIESMYSMYQNVFVHQLPTMPEMDVYLKQDVLGEISWDVMAAGSGTPERLRFRLKSNLDGTVIYIIGECVERGSNTENVCAEPYAIVCSILELQHKGIRIHGRGTDKSSVLRESPFLTKLYVELNKSFC